MDLDGGKWDKVENFQKLKGVTVKFYMHKNDETHVMQLDISLKLYHFDTYFCTSHINKTMRLNRKMKDWVF